MDKEGICSPEWILYIDCKAIFTNGAITSGQAAACPVKYYPNWIWLQQIGTLIHFLYCYPASWSRSRLIHVSVMHVWFFITLSCRLGATDSASSSSSSSSSFVNGATSKNLPAVQTVAPMPEDTMENMRSELSTSQSFLSPRPFTLLPLFLCLSPSFWLLFSRWFVCFSWVPVVFSTSFLSLFHFSCRSSSLPMNSH